MAPSAPAGDAAAQPCHGAVPAAIQEAIRQRHGVSRRRSREGDGTVLALLRPGSFVELIDHPSDLPPFQLIHCRGGRCWVRQQAWGDGVHWEVAHRRLTWAA